MFTIPSVDNATPQAQPWWRRTLAWVAQRLSHLAPLAAVLLFLAAIAAAFW